MPLPNAIRDLLQTMYADAEGSPDQQASRRITFRGKEYKVRLELENPDRRPGTVLITLEPRPDGS